jgi:hypothetical protein
VPTRIARRVAARFVQAAAVRILVDVPATLATRKRYSAFPGIVIATFDQSFPLYRVFDGEELKRILTTGKITGGQYAVKPEREHGASWGYNITDVINGGNRLRGKRLGKDIYLAKLDAFDKRFAHLDPEIQFDPEGPTEQEAVMQKDRCYWGLGCSVIDVALDDVDIFEVAESGQLTALGKAELRMRI